MSEEKDNFNRVRIPTELYELYQRAETALEERKTKTSFFKFAEYLVEFLPATIVEDFTEAQTPLEYRVEQAMLDPQKREAIEKVLAMNGKKKSPRPLEVPL